MSINQSEVQKYWEIFAVLANGGSHLDGNQAASVLKNSGLNDTQLENVWDLADIDNDGKLDFEEFCVAMKLIYNVLGGEAPDIPKRLPDYLVPESKSHLVAASQAISKTAPRIETPQEDEDDTPGLKDGFEWYQSPSDKGKYEAIYSANVDRHGQITFGALEDLYSSLDVPDTDIKFAWNLVNPNADPSIGKDQTVAFLHMLNQRNDGYRIPRSVPASLRASFEKNQINYDINSVKRPGQNGDAAPGTNTSKKNAFAEGYLNRLGVGGRTTYKTSGTDFSASKEQDWEEVRLKRQLAELEGKIKDAESASQKRSGRNADGSRNSKAALVRRELEQMLDYKRRELRDLEEGKGSAQGGASLASARNDLDLMKQQIDALESHLSQRESVLDDLRRKIDQEKANR